MISLSKNLPYKLSCLVLISFLFSNPNYAQLEADYWMFQRNYYVYFNQASTPDTVSYPVNPLLFQQGSACYSDKNGNLLFYTTEGIVYGKDFRPFPSLHPLTGSPLYTTGGNFEFSQPVLAVPYPGHDSLYILFHIRCDFLSGYQSSLFYSVINMNLRNGLGEISSQKNIPLLNGINVGFKLTAILHCNKRDIWVIGHLQNSDQYFSFLVTQAGVSASPSYFPGNYIPKIYTTSTHPNNIGCAKVSPLGNRFAAAFQGMNFIELFDFNNQTGTGANLKTFTAQPSPSDTIFDPTHLPMYGPYGIEFSPTGDKLYVTSNYEMRQFITHPLRYYLYQFDATQPTEVLVQGSQIKIDSVENLFGGAIQMGNNGKMYVNLNGHLSEIANPENTGATCGYTRYKVYSGGQYPNLNLPVYLQSLFRYPVIATGNCQFSNISFSIQNLVGVSSVLWDFGDPASGINNTSTSLTPIHFFSQQGSYVVKAILYNANGCGADTIRKLVHAGPLSVFLGNDTTICQGDTLSLRIRIPNAHNQWSTGSTDTIVKITQAGTYWIRANISECVATDTINVFVRSLPSFFLGNDTSICSNSSLTLSAVPNPSNVSYTWNTGSAASNINVNAAGLFWLRAIDNAFGCSYTDSINIQVKQLPNFSLGVDTSLCQKDTLVLNTLVTGATSYIWSTGASSSSIKVFQTGTYWADVNKQGCVYRDSINTVFKPTPIVSLGRDTTLCEDVTMQLDAQNPGYQYLWQDNTINQTYLVGQAGLYFVKVTNNGCFAKDSINIDYDLKPVFTLGQDLNICEGMTVVLQPSIQNAQGANYLWNTAATTASLPVTQTGQYSLTVSNHCGDKTDAIEVKKGACQIYVPSAFTPNSDGLNEIFKAEYGENITDFKLQIFNRWGQKIFESKNINNGWDGRYKGLSQPIGTYVWIIWYKAVNDSNEKMMKGVIQLIR
jgi:gliding motility-associated-like protein